MLDGLFMLSLITLNLSYGAVARVLEARGTAGPPIHFDLST